MKEKILYVDDIKANLDLFYAQFEGLFQVYKAPDTLSAYNILHKEEIKVVITDQKMPEETGIEFVERVKDQFPLTIFMILTAYAEFETAHEAINSGKVYRLLTKPYKPESILFEIRNAIQNYDLARQNRDLMQHMKVQNQELKELKQKLENENTYLRSEIRQSKNFENIVSEDPNFTRILNQIDQIANSDASVLITGETGTGKELIARAVHNLSQRIKGPFITVNCAAIPETLLESELFGHERGAFTSAIRTNKGKFELAHGGTLFLDEIGEIPFPLQAKLLRAIEEGTIQRIGGERNIHLDIRIVCATNRNLLEEIQRNNFRSDLYYRLNVFHLELPPLRDRLKDIPPLVRHFIDKYNKKYKKNIQKVSQGNVSRLQSYHWPGNVRELENIIERAIIISPGDELKIELGHYSFNNPENGSELPDKLMDMEREHILKILKRTDWKIGGKQGAAEILGLNRTTLIARMKKLKIER